MIVLVQFIDIVQFIYGLIIVFCFVWLMLKSISALFGTRIVSRYTGGELAHPDDLGKAWKKLIKFIRTLFTNPKSLFNRQKTPVINDAFFELPKEWEKLPPEERRQKLKQRSMELNRSLISKCDKLEHKLFYLEQWSKEESIDASEYSMLKSEIERGVI